MLDTRYWIKQKGILYYQVSRDQHPVSRDILLPNVHTKPWPRPLAQTPGPDLVYQDAAMETEAFIISENSCISTSRRTRAGWHGKMRLWKVRHW